MRRDTDMADDVTGCAAALLTFVSLHTCGNACNSNRGCQRVIDAGVKTT